MTIETKLGIHSTIWNLQTGPKAKTNLFSYQNSKFDKPFTKAQKNRKKIIHETNFSTAIYNIRRWKNFTVNNTVIHGWSKRNIPWHTLLMPLLRGAKLTQVTKIPLYPSWSIPESIEDPEPCSLPLSFVRKRESSKATSQPFMTSVLVCSLREWNSTKKAKKK